MKVFISFPLCGIIDSTKEVGVMISGIFFIIAFIGLLLSNSKYETAKSRQPSQMICPNCKSKNIKIQKEITSYSRGSVRTYGSRLSAGSGSTTVNRQRLGVCQDCGYDYPYVSQEEVEQNIEKTKNSYHFWLALTIIAAGIGIWVFLH